jgi:potassium voltage-gated channel Shab-related subfamily B protein 1
MVLVSTVTFILSTLDDVNEEDGVEAVPVDENSLFHLTLEYIDTFVIVFFTIEYLLRFICSPRKWKFFKEPMNLVDVIAIVPFYLALALQQLEDIQIIGKA